MMMDRLANFKFKENMLYSDGGGGGGGGGGGEEGGGGDCFIKVFMFLTV
jgi:hypothetical protein